MTQNQTPQKGLGLGNVWPWLFVIDELFEAMRAAGKGKEGKEPEFAQILWALTKILVLILISPFGAIAIVAGLLAWWLGLNPVDGLKMVGFAEILFVVLLVAWVVKKSRGPWSRAMKQARLELGADPTIKPGELATRVRNALGQDEAAAKYADDVARKLLGEKHPDWIGKRSQAPTRQLVVRLNRGGQTKKSQPWLKSPRSTVKRLGEQSDEPKDGWDIR